MDIIDRFLAVIHLLEEAESLLPTEMLLEVPPGAVSEDEMFSLATPALRVHAAKNATLHAIKVIADAAERDA